MSLTVIRYHRGVSRWEPDARGRLTQAAIELYVARGFEQTTVAEIAKAAGLTERTFFRYFSDKREVLFWGAAALQDLLVDTVTEAPPSEPPIAVIARAIEAAGALFEERREGARLRQSVIAANAELQERELIKLSQLASAMAEALRERGVHEPAASLSAEAGIAVLKIAFEQLGQRPSAPGPARDDARALQRPQRRDAVAVVRGGPSRRGTPSLICGRATQVQLVSSGTGEGPRPFTSSRCPRRRARNCTRLRTPSPTAGA